MISKYYDAAVVVGDMVQRCQHMASSQERVE